MAIKSYICDECQKEFDTENIHKYMDFDLCNECNTKYISTVTSLDEQIQLAIQKQYKTMKKEFPNIYPKWELPSGRKRKFELRENK